MIPLKHLLAGLLTIGLVAASNNASARDLLGSSIAEAKLLLPADAAPQASMGPGDTLTYKDVRIGDVTWSEVTMRFDAGHKLSSLSLRTRDMSYEALHEEAQAQLQAYAAEEMRQQTGMGTVSIPAAPSLQIRLCQTGDSIEMTYERAAQTL